MHLHSQHYHSDRKFTRSKCEARSIRHIFPSGGTPRAGHRATLREEVKRMIMNSRTVPNNTCSDNARLHSTAMLTTRTVFFNTSYIPFECAGQRSISSHTPACYQRAHMRVFNALHETLFRFDSSSFRNCLCFRLRYLLRTMQAPRRPRCKIN